MSADAGYSGTPLVRKLGLEPGMSVRLLDAPESYWRILDVDPDALDLERLDGGDGAADFTHLFATASEALARHFRVARAGMRADGMVWASWPKKASGVPSEISKADVRRAGLASGLVDIKICAVDGTWSGLRFVIPLAERR